MQLSWPLRSGKWHLKAAWNYKFQINYYVFNVFYSTFSMERHSDMSIFKDTPETKYIYRWSQTAHAHHHVLMFVV